MLSFLAELFVLVLLCMGLFLFITGGFAITVTLWLYPVIILFCTAAVALFESHLKVRQAQAAAIIILLAAAVILFAIQTPLQSGALRFYTQVRAAMNNAYSGSFTLDYASGDMADVCVFLAAVSLPIVFWLAFSMIKKSSLILGSLLLFPVIAFTILSGANISVPAMFLIFFGIIGYAASARSVKRKRLFGGGNAALYAQNEKRFLNIRKQSVLLVLAASLVLTIPAYYAMRPFLGLQLAPAEAVAAQVQNKFLGKMLEVLPDISAGQWNLEVETAGGGVSDGSLGQADGYDLEGVQDLSITVSSQPQETIYLRGYIGTRYTGAGWETGYESTYDATSLNWNIDGDQRLYIQNLPFLRTAYAVQNASAEGAEEIPLSEPLEISVERLNANENYTYVPYGAYLNDYYTVEGGDGYIDGQDAQEDKFYFYERTEMESILSAWNLLDDTASVLDRTEEAYASYCESSCLEVADGLDDLAAIVAQAKEDYGWDPQEDVYEISSWIRTYLSENFTYELSASALEDGTDFLQDFLYNTKTGYSVHFASVAVEMFRMFGVPARYVVGYEAQPGLFSVRNGGTYVATLESTNSQAWAEIYINGIGWTPQDLTPGAVGTLEEVGPGGEKVITPEPTAAAADTSNIGDAGNADGTLEEKGLIERLTDSLNNMLSAEFTVEQVIHGFTFIIIAAILAAAAIIFMRRYFRDNGIDLFHRKTKEQRLLDIFRACVIRLHKRGMPVEADTESPEFIKYAAICILLKKREKESAEKIRGLAAEDNIMDVPAAASARPELDKLLNIRTAVYEICYGERKADEQSIIELRRLKKSFF